MSRDPARGLAQFFGGRLCLDFANTLDWRLTSEPQELIPDYATFLRWSRMRGLLPAATIDRLQALSGRQPATAELVMREVRALRDDIGRAATALCQGDQAAHRQALDLAPFNHRLAKLPAQPRLVPAVTAGDQTNPVGNAGSGLSGAALGVMEPGGTGPGGAGLDAIGYVYDLPGRTLEEPLWPILWSWAALLTSHDATRLGSCQGQGCGWFFVDESPNHSRLWCSSEVCGNRERARRAYAKRRAGATG